jgi:hypothetical protein
MVWVWKAVISVNFQDSPGICWRREGKGSIHERWFWGWDLNPTPENMRKQQPLYCDNQRSSQHKKKKKTTIATGLYSHLPLLRVEGWCRGERLWLVTAWSHGLRGCGGGVGVGADNSMIWWCPPRDTRRRLRDGLSLWIEKRLYFMSKLNKGNFHDSHSAQIYIVRQFNSWNGPVKAKFAYLCTSGCCRIRNTLLLKLCTAWDHGATAGHSFENRFQEYLAVTFLRCVGCQKGQQIFVLSGAFFNFGKSQKSEGAKSGK